MARPVKVIFFDLGETLVTQNIEDNMVTKNVLREISPILPKRVSPERLFELYREGYKINETIRSRHHVEIPIQVWMRQLLERIIEDKPTDQLVRKAIKIIVKARAANAIAFDDAHSTLNKFSGRDVKLGIISNVSSQFAPRRVYRTGVPVAAAVSNIPTSPNKRENGSPGNISYLDNALKPR